MNKLVLQWAAATAIVAAVSAAPAWSQDRGFYLGLGVGQAKVKNSCSDLAGSGFVGSCDEKDTAWSLFGGYRFNANVAVEGGYTDFGRIHANGNIGAVAATASVRANAWELTGVGSLPLGNRFGLYAKLGIARWDVDGTATASLGAIRAVGVAGANGTDATWGLGATLDLSRNLSARLGFQRYESVGDGNTGSSDIDVWSVGLQFRF